MNPERWHQIKELFDHARTLPPNEQALFIERSCGDDSSLREQVETLLRSYESGFLEEPLLPEVGDIVGAVSGFEPGKVIGRYRIKELIGTGGMGEVFLADDMELNRPVAFKVLHGDVAEDNERVRRFTQEARAASALNHPNILTIHEIGSFEGSRFIVSEYVDGETLRERMAVGLTAAESLEITCQVAAALQAAHSAGIVHRDIKPENIMLRKDGLVKVLDFGLAKLTEADDLPIDANAQPLSRLQTSPGLIMGTVAYMSPEQASGKAVDARTDLWSLGVVFHEMLTGESPFKGESVTDLVTSILKHDPASLDLTEISQELQPICKKALARDLKARYQTAQDLLKDLQGEKKRMEYAIQTTPYVTVSGTDELKTQLIRPRPTLSAEYIVTSVKRHKYATFASLALVTFLAVGFSVYKYNGAPQPNSNELALSVIDPFTKEEDLKFSKLATSGNVFDLAISPDGKYVAYVTRVQGSSSIRLRHLESSSDVEITTSVTHKYENLSFTPDGKQIYYLSTRRDAVPSQYIGEIYKVPIIGGAPIRIIGDDSIDSGGSISPDGKTMAFTRELDTTETLFLANVDGSKERILKEAPVNGLNSIGCGGVPAWSPDGKSVACWLQFSEKGSPYYSKLVAYNVSDGSHRVLSDQEFRRVNSAVFMPDGNLVVAGRERSAEELAPAQLWLLTPNSPAKRITNGVTGFTNVSSTIKGDVLMTLQARNLRDLWVLPDNEMSKAKAITSSGEIATFSWMPDGKIVLSSIVSGNADIWTMNAEGTERKQLTANQGRNIFPSVSADGKYIVFLNLMSFHAEHVFRMDANGANLKQLTTGRREWSPRISPDGKWVYYIQDTNDNGFQICKVSIDGGQPTVLAIVPKGLPNAMSIYSLFLDVSPRDGLIAYQQDLIVKNGRLRNVVIISPNGGPPIQTLALPSTSFNDFRWTPDGKSIAFIDNRNGISNIWSIPVNGKAAAKSLTSFPTPQTIVFDWSKDGKQLGVVRGTSTSEAVVIRRTN